MTTKQRTALIALVLATTSVGLLLGFWSSRHFAAETHGAPPESGTQSILYWYDPMKPDQHFDKPGKSPFMDMQLIPKYAEGHKSVGGVTIDPRIAQNLGIRIATVEAGRLQPTVTAAGIVRWNERQVALVQARSAGFVERAYGRAAGDLVDKGARLVDLLVPEWAGAQAEFLALRKQGDQELVASARTRLQLLGMPADVIARVEATGRPQAVVTITSPIAGVIQSLDVRQGMAVGAGASIAEIKGIDPVWVEADIPEALAGTIAAGDATRTTLAAYPGQTLTGTVIAILPAAVADSRTVRARIELRNPGGRLRDGMYAQVSIAAPSTEATVIVPSEALIRSGTRNLIVVATDDRHFEPTEVTVGIEAGGKTQVLHGLHAGQKIVVSGQFLIDSEASLRGALTRLGTSTPPEPAQSERTP